MPTHDIHNRPYARLDSLKPGDIVIADDGFDCLLPWQPLTVVEYEGELAVFHNTPECGACGGDNEHQPCPHGLEGQLDDETDALIGIYLEKDFIP